MTKIVNKLAKSRICDIIYLMNPTSEEYNDFLLKHKELRIFQDKGNNFYVFPAKDATHFAFEKKLGVIHKTGTNLGITSDNKIHPEFGMMPFLEEIKESLSPELYKKNIDSLELFLTWLNANFEVDMSSAKSKISKI